MSWTHPAAPEPPRHPSPASGSDTASAGPVAEARARRQECPTLLSPQLLLSLVGLTLLLCGGIASVPEVMRDLRPRTRVQEALAPVQDIWIVQALADRWYVGGQAIERDALARRLHRLGEGGRLRYLPSAALSLGEVSASLRWLRRQGNAPVQLELPPRP